MTQRLTNHTSNQSLRSIIDDVEEAVTIKKFIKVQITGVTVPVLVFQ